jgi:predicted flap endonuclease-1-like 5' DNA nuclease
MAQTMKELQRIKGIGPVFARRFLAAGYDTISKIAAAGEEGLGKIRGINAQMVQSILTQARELAGEVDKTAPKRWKS